MAEHEAEREGTAPPSGERSVADLVDALFKSNTRPDGREFSYNEIATTMRERYGRPVDPSHIGKIRAAWSRTPAGKRS